MNKINKVEKILDEWAELRKDLIIDKSTSPGQMKIVSKGGAEFIFATDFESVIHAYELFDTEVEAVKLWTNRPENYPTGYYICGHTTDVSLKWILKDLITVDDCLRNICEDLEDLESEEN